MARSPTSSVREHGCCLGLEDARAEGRLARAGVIPLNGYKMHLEWKAYETTRGHRQIEDIQENSPNSCYIWQESLGI